MARPWPEPQAGRPLAWLCWAWPLGALPMLLGGLGALGWSRSPGAGQAWGRIGGPRLGAWPQRLGALALLWALVAGCASAQGPLEALAIWLAAGLVLGLGALGWRAGRVASEAQGRRWLQALALSGAAVGLLTLALALALRAPAGLGPWVATLSGGTGDRPAFPFGHPNQLAAALVLATGAAGALALRGGRWAWVLLWLLAALVATGSRAGLIGATLALGALGLRQALAWRAEAHLAGGRRPFAFPWPPLALGLGAVALLGVGFALNPWWAARWLALTPSHPSFDQARLAAWEQAWLMVVARPWWGWGWDAWAWAPKVLAQALPHPHQAYLHVALVLGLPGAALAATWGWGAVVRAWRLAGRRAWPAWGLASGLGACLAMGLVDEALLELRLLALAIALGACLWAWPEEAP